MLVATAAFGQRIIDPGDGFVNDVIHSDTTAAGERQNTEYIFKRGQTYFVQQQISNVGWAMTLRAEDGDGTRPILRAWPNDQGALPRIVLANDDCYIYNLVLDGMGPDLTTTEPDPLYTMNGQLVNANGAGKEFIVDGCVLNNAGQVHVRTSSGARKVQITNTIFANMGQVSRDNLGNGRGFDLRAGRTDTIIVRNCTFVNGMDRIIRHLDSGGADQLLGYVEFDHNTFLHWLGTFGMMMLGDLGAGGAKITNNLFYNPQIFGEDHGDPWRGGSAEWDWAEEFNADSQAVQFMLNSEPNDSVSNPLFVVHHNVIYYEPAALDYQASRDTINAAPFASQAITNAVDPNLGPIVTEIDELSLTNVPNIMQAILDWYRSDAVYGQSLTTTDVDMDRRTNAYLADELDASYTSSNGALVGSDGMPVGDLNWGSMVTSVAGNAGVPATFELSQNFPNPFNPVTTINYSLENGGKVTLKVYNTLGKEVATLVNEVKPAGSYSLTFEPRELTSGMYFYKLSVGDQIATKKMVLLK
jgi:hypothetical protein